MSKSEDNLKGCLGLIIIAAAIFVFCCVLPTAWFWGGIEYSEGFREGHLQKVSHKGLLWKTYEGQLILEGVKARVGTDGGAITNVWDFSVANPETAAELEKVHQGQLVRLHYKQRVGMPPWKADTQYLVERVEVVKE